MTVQNQHPVREGIAAGTSIGAGILLAVVGVLQILEGISAVAKDDLIVVGPEYLYQFDLTTWGWWHIIFGAIALIVAIGLLAGQTWGRVLAMVIAAISIIANFLWLPYYPWWSILIIIINIVVIWAVATWRPHDA
ncbi:DUF7144 family membrane protein [Nocardia rhizosphaerihabitans]|uniref:DUF7144 domain-containing protein n=1 Tax=Nocardia rhizosphaerihabitans TaxID=1691570 RepID=A0ABQ2L2L0_9NOCA|nr:hypothetical protein [Nocardia rhizosphaerihabitans]GGO00497.1 hypothetical protein GCM10011610_69490 [Nocardia rhizosphaerihabitans]